MGGKNKLPTPEREREQRAEREREREDMDYNTHLAKISSAWQGLRNLEHSTDPQISNL